MIDSVVKQYKKVGLWIIAGFMLVFLLAIQITSNTAMLTGLMVCVLYFFNLNLGLRCFVEENS